MGTFHVGDYKAEAPDHRGWFVGTFIEDGGSRTEDVEIKYAEFPVGPTDHGLKTSAIFECSIVLEGSCRAIIADQEFVLRAGEYVSIQPDTPNNLVAEILEPLKILTIKAPSDPTAKKVL